MNYYIIDNQSIFELKEAKTEIILGYISLPIGSVDDMTGKCDETQYVYRTKEEYESEQVKNKIKFIHD